MKALERLRAAAGTRKTATLAGALGVTPATLRRYLRGERRPSARVLALLDALGDTPRDTASDDPVEIVLASIAGLLATARDATMPPRARVTAGTKALTSIRRLVGMTDPMHPLDDVAACEVASTLRAFAPSLPPPHREQLLAALDELARGHAPGDRLHDVASMLRAVLAVGDDLLGLELSPTDRAEVRNMQSGAAAALARQQRENTAKHPAAVAFNDALMAIGKQLHASAPDVFATYRDAIAEADDRSKPAA